MFLISLTKQTLIKKQIDCTVLPKLVGTTKTKQYLIKNTNNETYESAKLENF